MAKMQAKVQADERDDGLREKMISVNRVTKVVKGGDSAEVMGAAFKALNDEQKRKLGVSYGIEVTGLTSGKLKDAGIKKGFIIMIVNNQKISAPEDLEKIVESILQGRTEDQGLFIKGFYPNGRTKYYAIDLAE